MKPNQVSKSKKPRGIQKGQKHRKLTLAEKEGFLEQLENNGGRMVAAARAVGRKSLARFHRERERDPEFAKAVEDAIYNSTAALEDEALRRANEGWDEPVFFKGKIVGQKRKFSDTMLIFMLKSRDPKYRENIHTLQGPNGGAIPFKTEVEIRASIIDQLEATAAQALEAGPEVLEHEAVPEEK